MDGISESTSGSLKSGRNDAQHAARARPGRHFQKPAVHVLVRNVIDPRPLTPKRREIHVIADNLSTHKTRAARTFLLEDPHVRIHFTRTYSSWLNQVELWFSKIERDLLERGIFTSVPDLARRIRRYIRITTTRRNRSAGVIGTRRVE
jgi:transposase